MSLKKSKFNHKDKRFMRLALNLASDRIGLTGENPSVGCVIVKNNEVISIGQTGINGRPHAEYNAVKSCKKNTPQIKVATPYFKPEKNETDRKPDYYIHETDKWLVFPHELEGLSIDEINQFKPELSELINKIKPFLS